MAHRGRPGSGIVTITRCRSTSTTEAVQFSPRGSIGGEQQVLPCFDQDAGDTRMVGKRPQEGVGGAVDHVHPIRPGVRHVQESRARGVAVEVGVIEAGLHQEGSG